MSKKLKTLKDVESSFSDNDEVCLLDLFKGDDLRSVARKWVKAAEDGQKLNPDEDCGNMFRCDEYHCDLVKEWIKHFFNLGEDE